MIGEIKLWGRNNKNNQWNIIKIFQPSDTSMKRHTFLRIYQEDYPNDEFVLSTHDPDKSVGE